MKRRAARVECWTADGDGSSTCQRLALTFTQIHGELSVAVDHLSDLAAQWQAEGLAVEWRGHVVTARARGRLRAMAVLDREVSRPAALGAWSPSTPPERVYR